MGGGSALSPLGLEGWLSTGCESSGGWLLSCGLAVQEAGSEVRPRGRWGRYDML